MGDVEAATLVVPSATPGPGSDSGPLSPARGGGPSGERG